MRPPAGEDFYEVIDGRYQRCSTILTTNRAYQEWPELFDQPVLASAAIDRLAHGVTQLTITGESYRARGYTGGSGGKSELVPPLKAQSQSRGKGEQSLHTDLRPRKPRARMPYSASVRVGNGFPWLE